VAAGKPELPLLLDQIMPGEDGVSRRPGRVSRCGLVMSDRFY
jgi:hypothetical protein